VKGGRHESDDRFFHIPWDKGESVIAYVSKAVKKIQQSGSSFKVDPMGTGH